MPTVAEARAAIVAQIVDGADNSITPSKLRTLLTDLCDALDAESANSKLDATAAPTANDDSANTSSNGVFQVGSLWIDISADEAYRCVDATATAAVWVKTTVDSGDLGALAVLDTVDTAQIDNLAVTSDKLANDSVISGKLADQTDDLFRVVDNIDITKKLAFQLSGVTTSNTRTMTIPDKDGTIALAGDLSSTANGLGASLIGIEDSGGLIAATTVEGALAENRGQIDDLSTKTISFIVDGGGNVITTGVKGYLEIPFACTIQQATVLADASGSIVIDVWKDTYANYPPVDADSITASAPPTLSTAIKSQDSTLTGWTTSIAAGDILGFNVDSATTVKFVTLSLEVTVT